MAKGNSWQKKLMDKAKREAMKRKLGNEKGVATYCARAKPITARPLDRESIDDKPLPKGPKVVEKAPLPRKAFRSWGKTIAARDVKGYCAVAREERFREQARALIAALG